MAQAQKRVALVIGNGAYAQVQALENPSNDATAIADAFRRLGFDQVVLKTDLDYAGFRKAMVEFSRLADGADVAVVYYAGHGIEIGGRNYLIPVDAKLQDVRDADFEAMPLDLAMATLDGARQLRVVILDACRDNPFGASMRNTGGTRSIGRGLARVETPGNTLVAYAAKEGTTADDGKGANSPFTTALLQQIEEPGVEVRLMFGRVRDAVLKQTNNRQEPFVYGAVGGREIFLKPAAPAPVVVAPSFTPSQKAAPSTEMEAMFWNSVKDSTDPGLLMAYVERYPDGTFSGLAKVMISRLETVQKADQERLRKEGEAKEQQRLAALTPATSTAPSAIVEPVPETPEEMVALARHYETGQGVVKDPTKAAKLYRGAARKGNADAKYRLALLYYRGEGVDRSFTEAAVQILDAVKANHRPAVEALSSAETLKDSEFLKLVQGRLKALGYYQSIIDGKWGPGSRNAVVAFANGAPSPSQENSDAKRHREAGRTPSVPSVQLPERGGTKSDCGVTFDERGMAGGHGVCQ